MNAKNFIENCLTTPFGLSPKEIGREGEDLAVVTCVGSVYNRKSILTNILVG